MTKCPQCGKDGQVVKEWIYGPKKKKGPTFEVAQYQCAAGHKWRVYKKKEQK